MYTLDCINESVYVHTFTLKQLLILGLHHKEFVIDKMQVSGKAYLPPVVKLNCCILSVSSLEQLRIHADFFSCGSPTDLAIRFSSALIIKPTIFQRLNTCVNPLQNYLHLYNQNCEHRKWFSTTPITRSQTHLSNLMLPQGEQIHIE